MIKEVDDSGCGSIDIYSFFHIFRMGRSGELTQGSGLFNLYAQISEIDVAKEGVQGAAGFFEAKVRRGKIQQKKKEGKKKKRKEKRRKILMIG